MSDNEIKKAVRAQFGRSAEAYVTSAVHANQTDLRRMVELADLRGDELVLDIATGGGHTALAFAPHVREVIATDLTPAMLEAAERFTTRQGVRNIRFEQADAEALPYADASFNLVTCRVAAHHFASAQQFVREVARVLRPAGRFILVDTVSPEAPELDAFINVVEKLRDPSHVRNYTVSEWQAYSQSAGLVVEYAETVTKTIPFDDWCDRMHVAPGAREELTRLFVGAAPEARRAFEIHTTSDRISDFSHHSVLLVSRKL